MPAKKSLLLPVLAIAALGLIVLPARPKPKEDATLSGNRVSCERAQNCLKDADRSFSDAIAGLRRINTAKEGTVIGDRQLANNYIQRITELRKQLQRVSKEADRTFHEAVLPEINPADDDEVPL